MSLVTRGAVIAKDGPFRSKWNPLAGSDLDIIEDSKDQSYLNIIIEPAAPGLSPYLVLYPAMFIFFPVDTANRIRKKNAYGFFFEKNDEAQRINLVHKVKHFCGTEDQFTYTDCTNFEFRVSSSNERAFFGYGKKKQRGTFRLTCADGYYDFPIAITLTKDQILSLNEVTARINDMISSCLQGRSDLNMELFPFLPLQSEDSVENLNHYVSTSATISRIPAPCRPQFVSTADAVPVTPTTLSSERSRETSIQLSGRRCPGWIRRFERKSEHWVPKLIGGQ